MLLLLPGLTFRRPTHTAGRHAPPTLSALCQSRLARGRLYCRTLVVLPTSTVVAPRCDGSKSLARPPPLGSCSAQSTPHVHSRASLCQHHHTHTLRPHLSNSRVGSQSLSALAAACAGDAALLASASRSLPALCLSRAQSAERRRTTHTQPGPLPRPVRPVAMSSLFHPVSALLEKVRTRDTRLTRPLWRRREDFSRRARQRN